MMQLSEALKQPIAAPLAKTTSESRTPSCCRQEMQVLLRRAVLHSDGSVDFQIAWGCSRCGRRIL